MDDINCKIGENQQQADFINEHELLGRVPISRRTLYTWRDKGTIPYIKGARRVIYFWPSVRESLLRLQKGGANVQPEV
jgi:hypothetical protein